MSNPFEVEVKPKDNLELIINQVEKLELQIKENKKIEKHLKDLKQNLVDEIEKRELLNFTWTTPNNTKLTYVGASESKEKKEMVFATAKLKEEMPEIYEKYLYEFTEMTSPRKSYIRVTLPKEE